MNVEKLSLTELKALHARIATALPIVRARELAAVRQEMADLATSKGFAISELVGPSTKTKRAGATARRPSVKMRDAKGVIWAGRGRTPNGFDRASAVAVKGA
tara:strand:+ start:1569 stop:1874 length:306 start_codon:yes stop_codon:yes gene_type:complete